VDRLERLVNLVVALLDTRFPLTREQLRRQVGGYSDDEDNFHRNFERDKDLLRQMGIPVVTQPVDAGFPGSDVGYRVPRELYELADPGLTEDELTALRLAVSAVALDGSARGAATSALWKLGTARPDAPEPAAASCVPLRDTGAATQARDVPPARAAADVSAPLARAAADVSAPLAEVSVDERVAALFAGISEQRVVRFAYNAVQRRVDPWRLSYRGGRWYLAGFDHARAGQRLFRVDRIGTAVELEEGRSVFTKPDDVVSGPPPPWCLGDDEETMVDLKVDATQAEWVARMAGESTLVASDPDGSALFRLAVTNRAALRGFVLGLLDHAVVLGPPDVRAEMVAWLSAIAQTEAAATSTGGP